MNASPTSSSLLQRYQRVLILFILGLLVLLLVIVSGVIIHQQSLLLDEALARRGAATLQHLAEVSRGRQALKDTPTLQVIAQVALETDNDILGIAFLDLEGRVLASAGVVGNLPIDKEAIPSVVSTRDYGDGKDRVFLSPIQNQAGLTIGLSLLRQYRFTATRMAISAAAKLDAVIAIVFALIGGFMNVLLKKVKTLALQEAEKSASLAEAYDHLQKMQNKLVEAERMSTLGKLASSMAHELRNPLGAIKNAIYYIRDTLGATSIIKEDPTVGEFLDLVDKEIKGATLIITDLLDFSRGVKLVVQPTDLNATLHHVRSGLAVPNQVIVTEDYAKNLPLLRMDSERIRQVISNLCVNALQAMPQGGCLILRSGIRPRADNEKENEVFAEVEDNGQGIAPEHMAAIFEPLFTTKAKGTGLGLPISASIIKAHGGVLRALSQAGHTIFSISLPMEKSL